MGRSSGERAHARASTQSPPCYVPAVGYLSLACAILGLAAVAVAGWGKLAALGLGLFAFAAGVAGFRRGGARARLSAASGMALGLVALLLGAAKVALTLHAIGELERLLTP